MYIKPHGPNLHRSANTRRRRHAFGARTRFYAVKHREKALVFWLGIFDKFSKVRSLVFLHSHVEDVRRIFRMCTLKTRLERVVIHTKKQTYKYIFIYILCIYMTYVYINIYTYTYTHMPTTRCNVCICVHVYTYIW